VIFRGSVLWRVDRAIHVKVLRRPSSDPPPFVSLLMICMWVRPEDLSEPCRSLSSVTRFNCTQGNVGGKASKDGEWLSVVVPEFRFCVRNCLQLEVSNRLRSSGCHGVLFRVSTKSLLMITPDLRTGRLNQNEVQIAGSTKGEDVQLIHRANMGNLGGLRSRLMTGFNITPLK